MGIERLKRLRWRWRAAGLLYCLLLALAVGVPVGMMVYAWAGGPLWLGVTFFAACFVAALLAFPYWRLSLDDVVRYLDRRLPELEESCGLLLSPLTRLGPLQRLQAKRIGSRLGGLKVPWPFTRKLVVAGGLALVALGGAIAWRPFSTELVPGVGRAPKAERRGRSDRVASVSVASVLVRITPPAYTGRVVRSQAAFPLRVEQGAWIEWELRTSGPEADTVAFIFNDSVRRVLRVADEGSTVWRWSGPAVQPGFYQVKVGRQLSGMYPFELIGDEPPRITIASPKPYTIVDVGEPTRIPLVVHLRDDYGITDASVVATVSSGEGEAVKFREQQLRWEGAFSGGLPAYDLRKTLDLAALGLKPGDELYFYCRARDNHGQEARSETYIVSLADTARLMSLEGMALPTDVKPGFFRSERQIIIETEQLLRQKDTIPVTAFNLRSNDLGIDQKLLRLRYGKFLGEEAEEGDAIDLDTASLGAFGDATRVLDLYSDKHDNAEDATFFEPAIKQQLKATLTEMWGAELRLRTYKPREALPFCYKALRLLKDLQQQSRVYVAKTGAKVTPLNPAKRLTGELGGIQTPEQRLDRVTGLPEEDVLRIGLAVLDAMRAGGTGEGGEVGEVRVIGEGDRVILDRVEKRLAGEAATSPGRFLKGYEAMKRMRTFADVVAAEQAVALLLPEPEALPVARRGEADGGVTHLYFKYLNDR
jgi:hypothetical protein